MAGLVGYASSDEEDEVSAPEHENNREALTSRRQNPPSGSQDVRGKTAEAPSRDPKPTVEGKSATIDSARQHPTPTGPSPHPPSVPVPTHASPDTQNANPESSTNPSSRSGSPYSSTRALLRDLTLPVVPNLDMPESPPGSPPRSTTRKFDGFLELKRKKSVHFNTRISESTAARNPALMDRLLRYVGLDQREAYGTSLPAEVLGWDYTTFPEEAFRTSLRQGRERAQKEKEMERNAGGRTSIEFVAATREIGESR